MKTIQVQASRSYQVHIGKGLLSRLGESAARLLKGRTAAIVSDNNVWAHYGSAVQRSLEKAGFQVYSFVFPAGENNKNTDTFLEILNFLAENKLHRDDCVIALGGGVVGDVAGFAAACYLRGIPCIQVPTSLLAMVDASVGGKTAIDLPAGKNLCGAFCQPALVLCDIDTLSTLPMEIFREGCAEIIKYGVLFDPQLFAHLEDAGLSFRREEVIARCVELKAQVVAEDEFDIGRRQLLNFGHSYGHAIEAESKYGISHGNAVAIGMAMAARAGLRMGYCEEMSCHALLNVLEKFGLPFSTDHSAEALFNHMLLDKKASGRGLSLIIPDAIGSCRRVEVEASALPAWIKAGL